MMDHDRHSGGSRGDRERRGGREYRAEDSHRNNRDGSNREERHQVPRPTRSEGHMVHHEVGRSRERDPEPRAEERRHPRTERLKEEEDISNYEYEPTMPFVPTQSSIHVFGGCRFAGGQAKTQDGEEEGVEEEGKDATLEPNYGLSGKLTADTNTFRVSRVSNRLMVYSTCNFMA